MKRLYLLAAAVSVTGGMAFSAPKEETPEKEAAVLDVQTPPSGKQDQPAIPERLLDDSHMNEELGINEFTAPSIRKIFEDLEGLPEIPEKVALRARPERPPMDRCSLALQLGGMMADGFVIVQCGKMNEVKPIALDLSSYAKAIGAGERVNRHAASLLKNAEDGDLSSFKNNLALIQSDVEQELASLRDSDMANLIGLGGWIRALDAATAALDNKFAEDKAKVIFQPDVPEYFHYILDGVEPEMKERRDIAKIMNLLTVLQEQMTLAPDAKPTRRAWKPSAKRRWSCSKRLWLLWNHKSLSGGVHHMVLPLLTSLEVRLTPRGLYLRDEKLEQMVREDGRIPVPYNVSILNTGDGAVRIIGKKWTVRSHGDGTQVIEGDELFGSRPLLCQGQIFAFNGLQMLRLPARIQLTLLVRDEAGILYHTDPVSLKW